LRQIKKIIIVLDFIYFYKSRWIILFMRLKIKKQNSDGIVKVESSGDLKEIVMNEDFLNPDGASVALCFRGKSSSGIIELTIKEIEILNREIKKKKHLLGNFKILKFDK